MKAIITKNLGSYGVRFFDVELVPAGKSYRLANPEALHREFLTFSPEDVHFTKASAIEFTRNHYRIAMMRHADARRRIEKEAEFAFKKIVESNLP